MNVRLTTKYVMQAMTQPIVFVLPFSVVTMTLSSATVADDTNLHDITLYGTVTPTLNYIDDGSVEDGDSSNIDIRDYNSFVGTKGRMDIGDDIKLIYQGEWVVDLKNDGSFGDSRRAYAGLEWKAHRVALGKQRPPQYHLIGEHVDLFNNEYSPFGYSGPFFVSNMLTYGYSDGNLRLLAAAQFNGREGNNKEDLFNVGVSYQFNNVYLASSYIKTTDPSNFDINLEGEENTKLAVALSTTLNNLHLALAYQDMNIITDPVLGATELTGSTFDAAATYDFNNGYKLKLGAFSFDDGRSDIDTEEYDGFTIGLTHKVNAAVILHADYYTKKYAESEDVTAIAVGIKYDFNVNF